MIWGSLFILLVILASFALAADENQFDEDGFTLFEASLTARVQGHLYWELLPTLSLALAVFVAAMRLEYLTSHIGEKRPASHNESIKSVPLFARHPGTVLFSGTVFFVPFPRFVNDVNSRARFFTQADFSISSQVNF
jgi:hypothetical protein